MDVAQGERAEKELEAMMEPNAPKGDLDPEEREELWKESVRRYNAQRREEMRAAWISYHAGQATRHRRTLEALIEDHKAQAGRLCEAAEDWENGGRAVDRPM